MAETPITWIPDTRPLGFFADPFAIWRDGKLHLFVETYDYRDRVGAIDVLTLDERLNLLDRRPALKEPWHLSYPFIIETDGETYMLPEAHKSGRLTLYRAEDFPTGWRAAQVIELDQIPIDATPLWRDGLWWLFYTPATTKFEKVAALHVAYAERLTGPWTPHPRNPVRMDPSSSRPGGTPMIVDETVILPVQDCTRTYGGAIRPLHITILTPDSFEAHPGEAITAPPAFGLHVDGLHTLSAVMGGPMGEVTLIDAKRRHMSLRTLGTDVARQVRKAMGRRRS